MKRIIAMLLAIVMLVGNVPVQAFATEVPQETLACVTEGCTYGAGHTGECSTFVACGKDGCTFAAGHEGNCSNYVASEDPKAETAADAAVYVTVSNRGELGMAYEQVTVSDLNQDGKLSVDEALYAAHTVYGKSYASENGAVTKLWDVETTNVSFFLNHAPLSTDVSVDTVSDGDYLVASVDQDGVNDYDKYSRFDVMEKSVSAGSEFTLTLTDDAGNALAGMEIGLSNGNGSTTMTGLTTDVNGAVTLTLDQEGMYCVTAKGTVVESSIDVNTMEITSIETPIIAPVCIVKVTGNAVQQSVMTAAVETVTQAPVMLASVPSTVAEGDTELTVSGATITMAPNSMVGSATLTNFLMYKQNAYPEAPTILSATQNGTTVNVILAENTDPSYPLQVGFSCTGGVLKQTGNTCALNAGKGTMNVLLQVYANYGAQQPMAQATYTVNFSIPMGEAVTVTPPAGEGFVFTGEDSAYKDQEYIFTVTVNEGYDGSKMVVKINDEPVLGDNGTYTVASVPGDLTINVEGIVKKELCTVTLMEGEGYTISSDDIPYKGEDYTFNIAVDAVNYKADTLQVLLDGEPMIGENGVYTIPALAADHEVTATVDKKAEYTVNWNELAGVTITGEKTVLETDPYTFTVQVDNAYDASGMKILVNDQEVTLQEDGSYTIDSVDGDIAITVKGVEAKVIYTVTLTEGENYTISGQTTSYAGEPYIFTVTVDDAIYFADQIQVKVNGTEVELKEDGTYTFEALDGDKTVTVENVVERKLCNITKPEVDGVTFTGADSVREGKPYAFSIAVANTHLSTDMVVKVNGAEVSLENGSHTIEAAAEDMEITVEGVRPKEEYTVTKNAPEGVTIDGAETVLETDPYTFNVTVAEGYDDSNLAVAVVVGEEPVDVSNGYSIASVTGNVTITVTGVVKKQQCSITLPTGKGYTVTGAATAYAGDSYSFTVAVSAGYVSSNMVVTANGETVTGTNGSYTITVEGDTEIAVTGVEREPLPETELTVTDNVIDITDKTVYSLSSYYAKAVNIAVSGATVKKAYEDNTTIYILFPSNTADDAQIGVTFGTSLNRCSMSGTTGSLTLSEGDGALRMILKGQFGNSSSRTGTATYDLIFIREAAATEVPVRVQESDSAEMYRGKSITFDLEPWFTGEESYYLAESTGNTLIERYYTFTPDTAGTYTLVFGATNPIGDCPDLVTVTVTVKDIESGVWIGHTTSNGALNYVTFTDADGNSIEGIDVSYADCKIGATLPKTYAVNGKITAEFDLTQNSSGLPFITTSNQASGSSTAAKNKFTAKTTTLSNGAGTLTFYLYNAEPKVTSNNYTTFTVTYAVRNDLPVLAEGVSATAEATITAGQNYTLDLTKLFTDADGDSLTYLVSINGETAVAAEADYSYTNNTAGTYTLVFTANDGKGTSTATYTVTLTVEDADTTYAMTANLPEGLNPKFYVCSGYGEDGLDQLGAEVETVAGEAANGTVAYTLNYPTNASAISVRAEEWGGMSFAAEENAAVTLRQVQMNVVDYDNKAAESTNTVSYDGHTAASGTNGWLLVTGQEYTYTAAPKDTATLETASTTEKLEAGEGIYQQQLMLGIKNPITITVTTGATARLYNYDTNKYYYATEFEPKIIADNGDGTTTYSFVGSGSCLIYRVSMEGKVTKAGYFGWNQRSVNAVYDADDVASSYRLDDYSGTGQDNSGLNEDSVVLNVNGQNHLSMNVGDSRTLKAYRIWEIIKISYQNYIITPDFTFNILSGSDVVSLTEKDSPSVGEGDWMTLTALKEGTAVIEVTYGAMEIAGGSYDGIYGASDPARTGLVIVQVGGNDTSVNFGIDGFSSRGTSYSDHVAYNENAKRAWDAEFDTLYFTGTSGQLKLSPTASGAITQVAVSHNKGTSWTVLTAEDGVYTAPIVSGNNILRITTEAGVAYQVVRGDRITVQISDVGDSSDGDGKIEPGETARITLKGLHMPIPKMAGNYNPGFGGNSDGYSSVHLNYTANGQAVHGPGTQYTFINDANYLDIAIPTDIQTDKLTLTDGYIGVGVLGLTQFDVGGDSHRNIPDSGCGTRESKTTFHTRSILPEITVSLEGVEVPVSVTGVSLDKTELTLNKGDTETLTAKVAPENADNKNVTWSSSNSAVATAVGGVVNAVGTGTATITVTTEDGAFTATCGVTVKQPVESVSITPESAEVEVGKTAELTAQVLPENATDKTVTWTSSDDTVATVESGVVTGVKAGTATITATANNGVLATCSVTVTEAQQEPATSGIDIVTNDELNGSYYVRASNIHIGAVGSVISNTVSEDGKATVLITEDAAELEITLSLFAKSKLIIKKGYVALNGGTPTIAENIDETAFTSTWTTTIPTEWDANNEMTVSFEVGMYMSNKFKDSKIYTLTLKKVEDTAGNTAPSIAETAPTTGTANQYSWYELDLGAVFEDTETEDSKLIYQVNTDGEWKNANQSYSYLPKTSGTKELKFKAKDAVGAESPEHTITLEIGEYQAPEHGLLIGNVTDNGVLKSLTIQNAEGTVLPVEFEVDEQAITVYLPGDQVGGNDTVKAVFDLEQVNGLPFLSRYYQANSAQNDRLNVFETQLNSYSGSVTAYYWTEEPGTYENRNGYTITYRKLVGENQAPALADGVEATVTDSIAQYQPWSVDLSKIFTEPDEEAMTYTVSVNNGAAKDTDASYSYECSESGTVNFVFKAADPSGLTATYKVTLTVTPVPRTVVSTELTNETANGVFCKGIQVTGFTLNSRVTHYAADQHKITFLLQSAEDDASVELEFLSDFQSVMYYYASQSGEPTLQLSEKVNGSYTVTLENGEKILYLATTTAAKNERQDYQLIFRNQNNAPAPVNTTYSDTCTVQVPYKFDLSDKFSDQNNDPLDYYVSVNGGDKQMIDAQWEYTAGTTGVHTLVFTASDGFVDSEPYTVTLNAELSEDVYTVNVKLSEAVTPAFYITDSVSGENGDVLGNALNAMPGETADGWTTYQVIIPDNISRISVRGTTTENEESVNWGGMSILTKDAEGNPITDTVVLRQVKGVIDSQFDGKAPVEADAKFVIQTKDGEYPVSGSAYEEGGYLTYRYLLVAQDGYTYSTVATGSLAEKYGTKVSESTYSLTTDEVGPAILKLFIDLKNGMYVTVPQGSVVHTGKMSNYFKYYFFDEYYRMDENQDGMVTYILEVPAKANPDGTLGGEEFIRVQHPRGVTYWTYDDKVLTAGGELTLTDEDLFIGSSSYNSKTVIHDLSEIPTDVADIYLSINKQMYLDLDAGESYKLNVFRNWQAVEGLNNAKTALPDVHYAVISPTGGASDVVTITTDEFNSSVATVTANKAGTAIVLVTYDAMYSTQVCSDAMGYSGEAAKLSAIWPENTGVFVVSVGADGSSIVTNIDVDAEHDPIYYVGNAGAELSFTPDDGCTVSVARAIVGTNSLTYGGFSTNGVTVDSETGEVTVTGLKQGRHIIRVEKNGVATYQVVTTKQTSYTITDAQGNVITDKTPVLPGTELTIQFGDLYNPVNKLAGVYNSNCALYYTGEDGTVFEGSNGGTVFGFYVFAADPNLHKITVTVPTDWNADTYRLEGSFKIGGFGGGGGGHRGILLYETGRNVNNEAEGASGNPGVLPTITIPVTAKIPAEEITLNSEKLELQVGETANLVAEIKPADSTEEITWKSSNPDVATVESGVVTGMKAGTATITVTTVDGGKTDFCEVTVKQPEQPEIPEGEATVYFSFSHDAEFKTTNSGKVMALQKMTVPYFDLTPYGLEEFNLPQTHADYGKPTMFHLYIYATEVFQYGVAPEEAGKGYLKDYIGSEMFAISGTPGSVCMDYFWGENMNLNYYHNYIYPADETGYGITADGVPLKNGDIVTIGHFTSWSFFGDPTSIFNYIAAGNDTVVTSALQSDALSLQVYRAGPNLGTGGSNTPRAAEMDIYYVKADALTSGDVTTWTKLGTTDATGKLTVDLSDLSVGQYILAVAGQKGEKYPNDIVSTPGGIVLNVNEDPQVQKVIGMIDSIGEVTLDSEDAITAASDAYCALTDTQKGLVTNYQTLADAKQKLAELKSEKEDKNAVEAVKKLIDAIDKEDPNYQQQIQEAWDAYNGLNDLRKDLLGVDYTQKVIGAKNALDVMQKIDAIGEVALNDEEAIAAARKAYDALDDDQEKLVTNLETLTNAEDKLAALKVIQQIEAIGEVTLDDEEAIADALEAYDDLTDEQKKLVDNHEDLISAEAKLNVLKDKKEAKKVNDLIEKIDDVTLDDEETIQEALEAYEGLTDAQKEYVNYDELKDAQEELWRLKLSNAEISEIYTTTRDYLAGLDAPGVGSIGGEWRVIGLKRSGEDVAEAYYDAVVAYVQKNIQNGRLHTDKSSDNSRIILALTAIGKDVTNVGGHNLLSGLNEMSYISYQGINGVIWALIAFDSHNYPTPAGITREELVNAILAAQLSDGGWALAGETADPDMTGMALQALAPYYGSNEKVKAAVDEALDRLSRTQNSDGTFSGSEGTTCESLAQVITALTALGIDPETDARFVKYNVSALKALAAFYVNGGGFKHGLSTDRNMMATEQGFYALVSYYRYKQGQTALYDMSDVILDKDAAAGVVALINAIGTVDLSKEDEIGAARTAYDALTNAQKELVTNYKTLTDAETDYANLAKTAEDEAKADAVDALIQAIGTVNLTKEDAIDAARRAYNGLTTVQKALVDNYATLTAAEARLAELKDQAAADAVKQKIDSIGSTITLGSETKIKDARNAYDKLTAAQKTLVSNYQTLVKAEEALNKLKSTVSVTFSLLGCYKHGTGETTVHTLAKGNLQPWIAAKTYKVKPGATVKDLFEQALREAGLEWKNPSGNYVESIKYGKDWIGEFTNGKNSGWMYTLNGKHPGLGVNQQTLVNGDKVVFHYTDDYTKEEGNPSGSTTGTTTGTTSGTVSGSTNYITTTTATVNTETAESVDRLIEDIGEEITLDSEAKILAARAAYDKLTEAQKKLVEKYDVLVAVEAKLAELKGASGEGENAYIVTGDYLQGLGTPGVGAIGGEWMVIGLARSGRPVPTGYYDHVLNYVRENINDTEQLHSAKSSDNSRLILALTAIGKDVTNVDGHDLLKGLNDMDYIQKQGINGPIWALLAFDSGNYPVPEGNVSRDKLIDVILEAQLSDGGWALSGEAADPDMTGMAIQALAPYMESNLNVKKAVETAIWTLSEIQNDNGSFSSVDGPNSESIAQVIVALAALGIDADTDARFVKNGISAMDALLTYYIPGGGFRHILDGNLDGMSTEQAFYALVAYERMKQNQNFLYDMTDVIDAGGDVIVEETTEPTETPTEPAVEEEEDNGNNVVIWTGVMSICAAAIAVLLLNRKKLFGKF